LKFGEFTTFVYTDIFVYVDTEALIALQLDIFLTKEAFQLNNLLRNFTNINDL